MGSTVPSTCISLLRHRRMFAKERGRVPDSILTLPKVDKLSAAWVYAVKQQWYSAYTETRYF